jgi:hypothetical protein
MSCTMFHCGNRGWILIFTLHVTLFHFEEIFIFSHNVLFCHIYGTSNFHSKTNFVRKLTVPHNIPLGIGSSFPGITLQVSLFSIWRNINFGSWCCDMAYFRETCNYLFKTKLVTNLDVLNNFPLIDISMNFLSVFSIC